MDRGWRTWVEINQAALNHNVRVFKSIVGNRVNITPVVKANAYGHGLKEMASLAKKWPIWGLSVAYDKEAIELRKAGYRGKIMVLSWWNAELLPILAKNKIELSVYSFTTLGKVMRYNRGKRNKIKTHIKVDVGTTRIGFLKEEIKKLKRIWLDHKKDLNVQSVWSHLSSSEEKSTTVTNEQIKIFDQMKGQLPMVKTYHLACTAATMKYPESRHNLIRLGIGLYGIWPSMEIKKWDKSEKPGIDLKPVMSWKTRITQIKNVTAGTKIGYGQSYTAHKTMTIAIIPVGYADGLDRRASNGLEMAINGQRVKTVGRICMNLTMLDVSGLRSAKVDDVVTIIGRELTAEHQADQMKMIAYELVARVNVEIPRIIV